jgi:hypothetical protein
MTAPHEAEMREPCTRFTGRRLLRFLKIDTVAYQPATTEIEVKRMLE